MFFHYVIFTWFFLCMFSCTVSGIDHNEWCRFGVLHTMCTEKENGCNKTGITIITTGTTFEEKQEILNIHNRLRRVVTHGRVQGLPPATEPIPELVWDEGLETVAQRWADQCTLEHDWNRRTEMFPAVGQNMFFSATNTEFPPHMWKKIVQTWFQEYKNFVHFKGHVNMFGESGLAKPFTFWKHIGSFSQVIWAETAAIGCGKLTINRPAVLKPLETFFVCNYGPAGNTLGRSIYKTDVVYTDLPQDLYGWHPNQY